MKLLKAGLSSKLKFPNELDCGAYCWGLDNCGCCCCGAADGAIGAARGTSSPSALKPSLPAVYLTILCFPSASMKPYAPWTDPSGLRVSSLKLPPSPVW